MTCIRLAQFLSGSTVNIEPIVVIQLLTGLNRAFGVNEYPAIVFFNGFAVRLTAVVDPTRGISINAGVDHLAVAKPEDERVIGIVRVTRRAAQRFLPTRSLALILDDARAFSNLS